MYQYVSPVIDDDICYIYRVLDDHRVLDVSICFTSNR